MSENNSEQSDIPVKKRNIPNLSKKELSQLAKDIATEKVFCSYYLAKQPDLISMVFMPIALGALTNYSEEEIKDIGFIYEYYDKAGPRSINGYPMFFSCRFVSRKDAGILENKINQIRKVLETV